MTWLTLEKIARKLRWASIGSLLTLVLVLEFGTPWWIVALTLVGCGAAVLGWLADTFGEKP